MSTRSVRRRPELVSDDVTIVMPLAKALRAKESSRVVRRPQARERAAGRVVAVMSSKGGAGSTMLAVNLAHAHASAGRPVCLLDLDLQLGDALAALSLGRAASLAQTTERLRDGQPLAVESLSRHASGLHVLSQVGSLDDLDRVQPAELPRLIAVLRAKLGTVVIDGLRDFSEHAVAALDATDRVVVTTVNEVLALRRARWTLDILKRLGFADRDLAVVVNRCTRASEELAELFHPVPLYSLDNDAAFVTASLDRGVPLRTLNPGHRMVKRIRALATELFWSAEGEATDPACERGWLDSIFGGGR